MCMWHRRRMHSARNQPGEMCHVNQVECANFVGDLAHAGKINNPWICASTSDDQLRLFSLRQLFEIVIINSFAVLSDTVRNDPISFAGEIQMVTVSKVSAVRQIQSKDSSARLHHR